jgi:anthranilate phosphoribosyltransferase
MGGGAVAARAVSDLPATVGSAGATARAPLDAAPFLREIGRGRDGARGLARERAQELMAAILDGAVSDLALGAILLALRMKGEEADEIAGFLDALAPRLARAPARAPAWIVLPSYNGARAQANLVPLLALLLARHGLPVLVHGQDSEPPAGARQRVTTAQILELLGIGACADMVQAGERVLHGQPARVGLATFAPALSRLLALRPVLGVRNVAHTLAKLVCPVTGPALLVSSYTHPAFGRLQAELFGRTGMHALSLRGTDGEAVASARRTQAVDHWRDGSCRTVIEARAVAPADSGLPATDAPSTAAWTRAVLSGTRAAPPALLAQVEAIRAAVGAADPAPGRSGAGRP